MRPLAANFPARSELADRSPYQISVAEQLIDLEEELRTRERLYPGFVRNGTLAEADAARHLSIWRAILADYHDDRDAAGHHDWDTKVRELRRELALRRNAYPRWIASRTHPLQPGEACTKLERLDAVHFRYRYQLFAAPPEWTDPSLPGFPAVSIAEREERRNAEPGHAEPWRQIVQAAKTWSRGIPLNGVDFDWRELKRMSFFLDDALYRSTGGTHSDGEYRQLQALDRWLGTAFVPPTIGVVNQERKAA